MTLQYPPSTFRDKIPDSKGCTSFSVSRVILWELVTAKLEFEINTEACTYSKSAKTQNTAFKEMRQYLEEVGFTKAELELS